jgi:hypothetical protein
MADWAPLHPFHKTNNLLGRTSKLAIPGLSIWRCLIGFPNDLLGAIQELGPNLPHPGDILVWHRCPWDVHADDTVIGCHLAVLFTGILRSHSNVGLTRSPGLVCERSPGATNKE